MICVIVHVRRRKAALAESKSVATILYGCPLFSKDLKKEIGEGCIVLGGCTTSGDGSDPIQVCRECGYRCRPRQE